MLTKHSWLAVMLVLFACVTAYPQQININQLSPQTYEFVKYGNVPISHFTGESNLRIPLYTYQDRDFELPIYLGYNSAGFIPGKREGIVGLNWFLNAGGVITRRVNGWPDERTGTPTSIPTELHGLYYGIKNNRGVKTKTKEQVFNPANGTVSVNYYWQIDGCEVDPDDFMFNMPGLNGRFFLENNGSVRTLGNKPYKVDLTGFGIQSAYPGSTVNDSEIIITADNGYVYYFGGSIQYLEVSYPVPESGAEGYPVINAWHLRKIEAPNGRTVVYEYKTFIEGIVAVDRTVSDPYHYLLSVNNVDYSQWSSTCNDFAGGTCSYVGGSTGSQVVREATKTVYLEKIKIDNITIEFSYGEKEKTFYNNEPMSQLNQKTLQLNTMYVRTAGVVAPLKQFDFTYSYLGGSHGERQFLTSLKEAGISPFTFSYYKTSEIPDPRTNGLDHWGFWNGDHSTTTSLIPPMQYQANGDVIMGSTQRDANATKADVGLLQKVTYPTGGYTEFFYEGHDYTKRLERRSSGNFVPQLFDVTGAAGGARVRKIVDHDGERETNAREFKYIKNFPSGTLSSGILLSWPRYIYYWKYDDGSTVQHILKMKSSSYNVNFYPGEHFMQYGEVSEVVTPSNGYVNYKFTNFETHPDFNEYNTSVVIPHTQQYITNVHLYNSYVGIKLNERAFERGLPLEVSVYASKQGGGYYPVRKTTTQYQTMTNNSGNYVVGVHQTGGIAQSFKIYYYPVLPLQQSETTYSAEGTNSYTVVTNFTYNNTNFLLTKGTTLSDGRTQTIKYKYPLDFVTDADDAALFGATPKYPTLAPEIKALVDLKKNNILNMPVEVITYVGGNAVSANLTYFKDFANVDLSKKVYPNKSFVLKTSAPIASFAEASLTKGATWSFTKHAGYTTEPQVTYDRYDDIGNLIEMTDKDNTKKSYKWNGDKLYPIAEGIGMLYDEFFHTSFEDSEGNSSSGDCRTGRKSRTGGYTKVVSGLPAGTYILTYWKKQPDNSWRKEPTTEVSVTTGSFTISLSGQVDDVRFYPKRAAARMNTFTYDSGIGMTSKTDFNNSTEFYEYDSNGRFRLIRDTNRNIQKIIEYNYKIQ